MTVSEYTQLKKSVILAVSMARDYDNSMERLKLTFQKEINSPRCSEQIRSLSDLIAVLEKRNELAEDNVIALKTIARVLNSGAELEALISQYEHRVHNDSSLLLSYSYNSAAPSKQTNSGPAFSTPLLSPTKEKLMHETIANEIGSHWRDLARSLEIREGQIQEYQTKYDNCSDRITKVLEMSKNKSDPNKWFYQLCDALDMARRKDLRKQLQEILVMNI